MGHTLIFQHTDKSINYLSRTTVFGPESKIVYEFLNATKEKYDIGQGDYAVFLEPLLDTGVPDIVVVKYRKKTFEQNWNSYRNILLNVDLKILNYMTSTMSYKYNDFVQMLGISKHNLNKSLDRLLHANLVRQCSNNNWHNKSMNTIWGIQSISAIEAKIKECSSAVNQAEMNLWFANESCVLFPNHRISKRIIDSVSSKRMGVITIDNQKGIKTIIKPFRTKGPSSYASWLFNEWIGRKLFSIGETNDSF